MALITSGFDASSTADDVVRDQDLTGLRAVVTGASSGLGVETASALARAGAQVTLAVRDLAMGQQTALEISARIENSQLSVAKLDLADLPSVRGFAANWSGPLHLLINNAGTCAGPLQRTARGWEMQFATNHLGHFLLATELRSALASGARDRGEARIVAVSSSSHATASVDLNDPNFERREYDPWVAYGQSKSANVLFAVEATRRWSDVAIYANAVNPGAIFTRLQRSFSPDILAGMKQMEKMGVIVMKTPQQGAATTLVAAVSPAFAATGGHYLDDCNEAESMPDDIDASLELHRVRRWALDPETAQSLWERSLGLVA